MRERGVDRADDHPDSVPSAGLSGEFAASVIEQMFTFWIEPHLASHGLPVDRTTVQSAVVELVPGGGNVVRINEGVRLLAKAVASAPIAAGDVVTSDNISSVESFWPEGLDVDSGWLAYVVVGGQPWLAFDFRYNKGRARRLLELSADYLEAARSVGVDRPAPAIDLLYSAAKLTIQAQLLVQATEAGRHQQHLVRGEWLRAQVELKNAPEAFDATLQSLRDARKAARYGEAELAIDPQELSRIVRHVEQMIAHGRWRTGTYGED